MVGARLRRSRSNPTRYRRRRHRVPARPDAPSRRSDRARSRGPSGTREPRSCGQARTGRTGGTGRCATSRPGGRSSTPSCGVKCRRGWGRCTWVMGAAPSAVAVGGGPLVQVWLDRTILAKRIVITVAFATVPNRSTLSPRNHATSHRIGVEVMMLRKHRHSSRRAMVGSTGALAALLVASPHRLRCRRGRHPPRATNAHRARRGRRARRAAADRRPLQGGDRHRGQARRAAVRRPLRPDLDRAAGRESCRSTSPRSTRSG